MAILAKYSNYTIIFLAKNTMKLQKNIGINEHTIKLKKDNQPIFEPIYSLNLIELKILKIYIKINLANNFIRLFKYPTGIPILFDRKLDKSLYFCMDYWGLNNITINN